MHVADELDVGDLHLGAFANLENDGTKTADAIALDGVVDRHLVVPGLLVILAKLLGVLLHLTFVERLVRFDLCFLLQPRGLDLLVAFEADRENAKFRRDLDHQIECLRVDRLMLDLDELEEAGPIQGTNVAVENHLIEIAAFPDLHVGPDDLLVHVGRTHEFNRDCAHLVGRSLLRLLLLRPRSLSLCRSHPRCQQPNDRETQGDDPAYRVTDGSFQSG
jgi:hypothetical protein